MTGLNVTPVIRAFLAYRRAASDCCAAPLDPGTGDGWSCRACGRPCGRVLSDAEIIEAVSNG